MNTTIYFLRHAESQFTPSLPESEWPLSPRGHQQAQEWVDKLAGLSVDVCVTSPYNRAVDTLLPFASTHGLEILVENDLRERKLSEGVLDNWLEVLERAWTDFSFALPGAESSSECQQRMVACVERLVEQHKGKTLVLSSHGNAIALLLNALDASFGFEQWKQLQNPDLYKVIWEEGRVVGRI